jgi:hypothetical protein
VAGRFPNCPATHFTASTTALLAASFVVAGARGGQLADSENGSSPSAEILSCEIVPGDIANVLIYVGGIYGAHLAAFVDVLEQLVARQVPALLDDARQTPVCERDTMFLTALSTEMKEQFGSRDVHVPVLHGGEAEGIVLLCVFVVSDPDEAGFEQAHDGT